MKGTIRCLTDVWDCIFQNPYYLEDISIINNLQELEGYFGVNIVSVERGDIFTLVSVSGDEEKLEKMKEKLSAKWLPKSHDD